MPKILLPLVMLGLLLCGCTTVLVYQSPISNFQTAVNSANNSIRPYLLGVNDLIAKANLYDKVLTDKPWGTEDLHAGIPQAEIQVRLQALSTIASYANALGAVANANDVAQLQQAATALGNDVNGLQSTIQSVAASRNAHPAPAGTTAAQAATLNLSGPITALVTLFGTIAIENKQKTAIETAIINGDQPINQLIELLKADLRALSAVDDSSYAAMQTGLVTLYQSARAKTDPKSLIALIDDLVQQNGNIQTLRALQVDSLLTDMAAAHTALVTFAKSSKSPKDLSDLAVQINTFTAHVKLFGDAIAAVENTAKTAR